jgi:hypothetical protein
MCNPKGGTWNVVMKRIKPCFLGASGVVVVVAAVAV